MPCRRGARRQYSFLLSTVQHCMLSLLFAIIICYYLQRHAGVIRIAWLESTVVAVCPFDSVDFVCLCGRWWSESKKVGTSTSTSTSTGTGTSNYGNSARPSVPKKTADAGRTVPKGSPRSAPIRAAVAVLEVVHTLSTYVCACVHTRTHARTRTRSLSLSLYPKVSASKGMLRGGRTGMSQLVAVQCMPHFD